MELSPTLLEEITREIVDEVHPRKVILFGSWARGDAREDSDLDLLVVCDGPFTKPSPPRYRVAGNLYRRLMDIDIAKDILIMTPAEVADRVRLGVGCVAGALAEGKVLYDRV